MMNARHTHRGWSDVISVGSNRTVQKSKKKQSTCYLSFPHKKTKHNKENPNITFSFFLPMFPTFLSLLPQPTSHFWWVPLPLSLCHLICQLNNPLISFTINNSFIHQFWIFLLFSRRNCHLLVTINCK